MIKLGVTGNIASGKTLVEGFLKDEGVPTVDADCLVHELYKSDKETINSVYNLFISTGVDVRDEQGGISRAKLGELVFNDENKRKELEKIVHPRVVQKINEFFELNQDKKIAAAVVPLVYEAKMQELFDKVLFIAIDSVQQLKRLMYRNNLTEEQALLRIKSQIPQKDKIELADFVIDNTGSPENTKSQLKEVLNRLNHLV